VLVVDFAHVEFIGVSLPLPPHFEPVFLQEEPFVTCLTGGACVGVYPTRAWCGMTEAGRIANLLHLDN
jgi:hypothetical protein